MKQQLCYKIRQIPDLTLNKYTSLEGGGVDGVLEKHLSFLRQWNRKGILSGISVHLFYRYLPQNENGDKMELYFLVRGDEEKMANVDDMVAASPLSSYFRFQPCDPAELAEGEERFCVASALSKKEVFVKSSLDGLEENDYYTVPAWEMNDEGRLFDLMRLMDVLDKPALYRVDMYPVERGTSLRGALRKPMGMLRERIYGKAVHSGQRDYEAEDVMRGYEKLLENVDSSPHFQVNLFVFGMEEEDTTVLLDAAGAEALQKGSYNVSSFFGEFTPLSFLGKGTEELCSAEGEMILKPSPKGCALCSAEAQKYTMRYLPTLFTLEEAAPFFRLPTLYDGETVQKRKETAPAAIEKGLESILLAHDENGYGVHFPLNNLAKHAFLAGVPGSGKTNAMSYIASELWIRHKVPFLVLEPAKQEYRALANQQGMEDLYLFSPNADMTFPLHINPFEFPKGLMVAEHIRRLVSVFEGAFPLDNPMPFLLDTAIETVYRRLGWTPETVYTEKTKLKFPTLSMLYVQLEKELESTRYSEEVRGNLESALKVRIGSLLRREMGDVFNVPESTIPPERWLEIPAVIELESMGTGPANFLTLMLCVLIRESLKVKPHHDKDYARHVIVIEEAHNLIGPESEEVYGTEANPKQAATAFIVKMLAEVRALKEAIVIADQLPTVMAPEVIKNTGLKIGLRITSADDRALLGSTMAASGLQIERMAVFNPGEALISYEGLQRPFQIQVCEWRGELEDPEERRAATTPQMDKELKISMAKKEPYRYACVRSFQIDCKRLKADYDELSAVVRQTVRLAKSLNRKEYEFRQAEQEFIKIGARAAEESWNDERDGAKLFSATQRLDALRYAMEHEYRYRDFWRIVCQTLRDCLAFAGAVEYREARWRKLGVVDAGGEIAPGMDADGICAAMLAAARNMRKAAVLLAAEVFVLGGHRIKKNRTHFADAIRRAAKRGCVNLRLKG